MPKDEFDFEDPLELNGVGLMTNEDTTDTMCECFIEEFMRLGHNHRQLLALFRNPHFIGMNMVLEKRGEEFVKNKITEIFARWGRKAEWPVNEADLNQSAIQNSQSKIDQSLPPSAAHELDSTACDPMGAPIPKLNFTKRNDSPLND
jgi:hypothetical protein